MIITLNHKTPLGLPSGLVLQPGVPTPVHSWDYESKSKIVQAWVKAGTLKIGHEPSKFMSDDGEEVSDSAQDEDAATESTDGEAEEQSGSEQEEAPQLSEAEEKAQLLAALEAKGVKADKRTGVKKLRELLDKA